MKTASTTITKLYTAKRKGSVFCNAGIRTQPQVVTISWDGRSKMAEVVSYQRYHDQDSRRQRGSFTAPPSRVRISALWDIAAD